MRRLTFLTLTLLFLASCAQFQRGPRGLNADQQAFAEAFDRINAQAFKDLSREKDLEQTNIATYMFVVGRLKSKASNDFQVAFEDFEYKDLTRTQDSFIVCAASGKRDLALCDDAACEGVERAAPVAGERALGLINEWRTEIKPENCPASKRRQR